MQKSDFWTVVSSAFHNICQVDRKRIFGPNDVLPMGNRTRAETMWPGFVGRDFQPGGLLLIAHFPAGGTDAYEGTSRDLRDQALYDACARFKSSTSADVPAAFEHLMAVSQADIARWSLMRVIDVVLKAASLRLDEIALINAVPYRTAGNKKPPMPVAKSSWQLCAGPSIEVLAPEFIATLGKAAGDILTRFAPRRRLFVLPRRIGDKSINPEAIAAARELAQAMGKASPSTKEGAPEASISANEGHPSTNSESAPSSFGKPTFRRGAKRPSPESVWGLVVEKVPLSGIGRDALLYELERIPKSRLPARALQADSVQGVGSRKWWAGYVQGCIRRGFIEER